MDDRWITDEQMATDDLADVVLAAGIRTALSAEGAVPPEVVVERVEAIPRAKSGKAPLIRAAVADDAL